MFLFKIENDMKEDARPTIEGVRGQDSVREGECERGRGRERGGIDR